MAETVLHLRRATPHRRRAAAAATVALITHLAVLGLFLYATPRFTQSATLERSMSLDIVEFLPPRKPASLPPPALPPKPALAVPGAPEAPEAPELSPTQAAPARASTLIPSAPPGTLEGAVLGKALRGSVIGCAHADMANLTDTERQHCRDAFAANRAGGPDLSQLAISPEKRAIFDAAWKADHSPQHMAGVICLARFGGGKLEWLHPSEGFKLGPLPCYVYTPKATFSADPPHARGWK